MEGGVVERKLSLGLVRSFFALSIGDNILSFSLPCLGGYHWLRTIRLLRLQKRTPHSLHFRFGTALSVFPVALQTAVGRGVPPRHGGVGTRRPTLWCGSSDVPRRMCPNVPCRSLPVGRASDSYSHHSKHSTNSRPQITNHIAMLKRLSGEWAIRRNAVPKSQTDIAMLIRRNGECWL